MKIKKIGHCCLLIETRGLKIMTDPGSFSVAQDEAYGVDVVLITHEHADHLHTGSLKNIVKNNSNVLIITNSAVGNKLDELGIVYKTLEGTNCVDVKEVLIEAFDCKHEEIFEDIGQVQNTGYFIDNRLFYPGDSFFNPKKTVDILALPVSGPWCDVATAIRYALDVQPKKAFPVHDGMLQKDKIGSYHKVPEKVLAENGIEFVTMVDGDEFEF